MKGVAYGRSRTRPTTDILNWTRRSKDISRDLYRSSRTLTELIRKYKYQLKVDPSPHLPVGGAMSNWEDRMAHLLERPAYSFTSSVGTESERQAFRFSTELRKPTELEWRIIEAILGGTRVARLLPQFLRHVCNGEKLLRFQRTIVAQVEGELAAALLNRTPIYPDYQTSKRLVEAMMMETRSAGDEQDHVYGMLGGDQGGSVQHGYVLNSPCLLRQGHSVQLEQGKGPLPAAVLTFENIIGHKYEPAGASVWKRQLGEDGVQIANTNARYRVQLLNLFRFVEPTELAAYLRNEIKTHFHMYSLVTYDPRSRFSLQ
ncbi:hypothetical protein PybrP1_001957 [[Pythium] brassicae (nom. inval.)]|nr:hypothetical protein PybrP1_001957 [[Pythium] brassicae (nom. inval.)]